jgi:glycosyltransferase involved in cell wall biosynthesis
MTQFLKTLIIIPAYNEEESIKAVLAECNEYLNETVDILVVNDGSSDSTAEICMKGNIDVINIPFNMGVGNALKTGFKHAIEKNYHFVITLDADGQHDPNDLPLFFEKIKNSEADILIGSRFLQMNKYQGTFFRNFGNKFFSKLISLLIKEKLTDVTSGYRAFSNKALKYSISDNFNFDYPDADFLLTLHRAGFKFAEVPVVMRKRKLGLSQHTGFKPIYYIFKTFLSIFVILLRKKK